MIGRIGSGELELGQDKALLLLTPWSVGGVEDIDDGGEETGQSNGPSRRALVVDCRIVLIPDQLVNGDRSILGVDRPVFGNPGLSIFPWFDFDVPSPVFSSRADDFNDQIRSIGVTIRFPAVTIHKHDVRLAEFPRPQSYRQRRNEYFSQALSQDILS